jgi:hypothetical protein
LEAPAGIFDFAHGIMPKKEVEEHFNNDGYARERKEAGTSGETQGDFDSCFYVYVGLQF